MGLIEVADPLNTEPALRYVEDCKNGQFALRAPEDGCSLNVEMTKITDALYHRTCNFLDRLENKPYYTHGAYQQVIAIRKENRSRLEFVIVKATTPFSHMNNTILIELLHQSLISEMEALRFLEIIKCEIGANAVQQNLTPQPIQDQLHNYIPDQFKHQFQIPIQDNHHEVFQGQIQHAPIHNEFTTFVPPPPGMEHYLGF